MSDARVQRRVDMYSMHLVDVDTSSALYRSAQVFALRPISAGVHLDPHASRSPFDEASLKELKNKE